MESRSKVLITGINGFVGSHMAEECLSRGWEVHGTYRGFRSDLSNIRHLGKKETIYPCDLTDYAPIARILRQVQPDLIFHLAAQSYVPESWSAPRQTFDANVIGTLNLMEAIRHESPASAVQFAGSSEEHGMVKPDECPITEDSPLRPLSPYGVSKVAGDLLVRQYSDSYGIHAVVTRAFNHTGPRRGKVFAESDWCRQAVMAEMGLGPFTISHGNLDAVRDYTDVRDIVKGYILAIQKGQSGEVYQLTSGNGLVMRKVLAIIIAGVKADIRTVQDPKRMRPSDVPLLIGTTDKAKRLLGWEAKIDFEQTISDLLDYWRNVLKKESVGREIGC